MLNVLQISDFEMRSRNQTLNSELLRKDLENLSEILKNLRLRLVKQTILRKHPLLKMEDDIRLKMSRLPLLKNQLDPIHPKPP